MACDACRHNCMELIVEAAFEDFGDNVQDQKFSYSKDSRIKDSSLWVTPTTTSTQHRQLL